MRDHNTWLQAADHNGHSVLPIDGAHKLLQSQYAAHFATLTQKKEDLQSIISQSNTKLQTFIEYKDRLMELLCNVNDILYDFEKEATNNNIVGLELIMILRHVAKVCTHKGLCVV